jgi:hypothetical protein
MIHVVNDAEFWKAELWRETSRLREALEQQGRDYYAARPAYVERYAFVTAYEMRKLEDAEALTLDVTDYSCDVLACPVLKPPANVQDFLLRSRSAPAAGVRIRRLSGRASNPQALRLASRPSGPGRARERRPCERSVLQGRVRTAGLQLEGVRHTCRAAT